MKSLLLVSFLFVKTSVAIDYPLNLLELPPEIIFIILNPLENKIWQEFSQTSKKSFGITLTLAQKTPTSVLMKDIFLDFKKIKMPLVKTVIDTIKNIEGRLNIIADLQVKKYGSEDRKKVKTLLKKILLYSWSPTFICSNGYKSTKRIAKAYQIDLNKLHVSRKDKILYAIYRDPIAYYSLWLISAGSMIYPLYCFIDAQMHKQQELLIEAYAKGYLTPNSYKNFFIRCPYGTCSEICSSITRTIHLNCKSSCGPDSTIDERSFNYTNYELLFPKECRFPELGDFNKKWPRYGEIIVGNNSIVAIPYVNSYHCDPNSSANCGYSNGYNVDVEYNIEIIKYNATYLAKSDNWSNWVAIVSSGVYIFCFTFLLFVPLCI
jgi:hypothetical protein